MISISFKGRLVGVCLAALVFVEITIMLRRRSVWLIGPITALLLPLLQVSCAGDVGSEASAEDGGGGQLQPDLVLAGGDAQRKLDSNCGATGFQVEPVQPNVLVLFDRSCSMRRRHDLPSEFGSSATDPKTRWYMARQALDKLTQAYQTRIRFGLMVFPEPAEACGDLPALDVAPATMARKPILAVLDKSSVDPFTLCTKPGSSTPGLQEHVTPTAEAMTAASKLKELKDPSRASYILLITDGYATCNATAASLGAQTGALKSNQIKTAVVGFGDVEVSTAIAMLDAMASAGGLPKSGGKHAFWLATSPAELQQTLDAIVSQAVGCSFTLKQTPPDKDKLYAFHDGKQVPYGSADGWSYDAATHTVTFLGASCQQLKQGKVKNVSVVFGCPDPTCVPGQETCDGFDNDCDGKVDEGCIE